jgi:dihydrofolate reductase
MKITLSFVASADGRVTGPKGEQSRTWASPHDQSFFAKLIEKNGLVIMGRNTYEKHKRFFSKTPHIRRIVMTSGAPDKRAPLGVEFSTLSPAKLVQKLRKERVKNGLLAGGPRLSAAFFKAKAVNELILTIEPRVFGGGLPILEGSVGKPKLSLLSVKKLNSSGALLLRYKVHV